MNYLLIALQVIAIALLAAGFIGIIIPLIPDFILIFAGIFIYAAIGKFQEVGWLFLVFAGILTVLMFFLDWISQALGAKKFGATKYGMIGAVVGAIMGFMAFSVIGMIFGAVAGTIILEITLGKKEFNQALRIGIGAFVGYLFVVIIKLILATILIGIFLIKIF